MGKLDSIRKLSGNKIITRFAEFVISESGEQVFPDYKTLDLMKIANLVQYTWVIDFTNGIEEGLLLHFSGTKRDDHYGRNCTGLKLNDLYTGEYSEQLIEQGYNQVYLQGKTCFSKRSDVHFINDRSKYRVVESLMFPCSSNQKEINYGLGITEFIINSTVLEPQILLLD